MEDNFDEVMGDPKNSPDEGEPPKGTTSVLDEVSDEEKQRRLEAFPRIYRRMKEAEEKAKEAKVQMGELRKKGEELAKKSEETLSPDEKEFLRIAEATSAFEGLDDAERKRLMQEAKLKGIPLGEAKKDSDFILWQKSYKEKVEAERKVPEPTFSGGSFKKKPLHELSDKELKESYAEVVAEAVRTGRKTKENI